MKTDKNTVVGFVLIGLLFIGYFWMTGKQQQTLALAKKRQEDSIAKLKVLLPPKIDTTIAKLDSLKRDSANYLSISY